MAHGRRGVAVVTGGSAGVGREAVRHLARRGWDVAVLARGPAGCDQAVAEVEACGQRGIAVNVDVADSAQMAAAAGEAARRLGVLDVWVNVAFVGALRYFWDTDERAYRRITDVSYLGQVHGTRAALAHMRPRNRGVVINVGSALAYRGIPLQAAYCGAKHAVKGFTESVITELKHEGSKVRVCMVQLPALNTTQFNWNDNAFEEHPQPVPPIFQPELAGRAIAYLAEHPRRNMWVGASTALTVLGNRVAPWALDWYLARTGVRGQLSEIDGARWGSNVFEPKDARADRGSHGVFDDQAHESDPWSWASMHRTGLAAAAMGAAATVGGLVTAKRRS